MAAICNHLPASGESRRRLVAFVNSLDPDQARQNVGPNLHSSCRFDPLIVFLKQYVEKRDVEKSADDKIHEKLPSMQRVKVAFRL